MNSFQLVYKQFGESAILIEWPKEISPEILYDISLFVSKIELEKNEVILELNFVYNSLLVMYNNDESNFNVLVNQLQSIYLKESIEKSIEKNLWEIPVCYDLEYGLDLKVLATEKKKSIEEIIARHCSLNYMVYGIGFLPGFLYLGGLNKELFFSRKKTPRLSVPKGSVGIGGNQTGIYPKISPGGWNILGRTPILLFDVKKDIPCEIQPGDLIRFEAISKEEFIEIEELQRNDLYQLEHSKYD